MSPRLPALPGAHARRAHRVDYCRRGDHGMRVLYPARGSSKGLPVKSIRAREARSSWVVLAIPVICR
jgi:hypothetical protein